MTLETLDAMVAIAVIAERKEITRSGFANRAALAVSPNRPSTFRTPPPLTLRTCSLFTRHAA
eukprot:3550579-Rhodomonas_salina.4